MSELDAAVSGWGHLQGRSPDTVDVGGIAVGRGSRLVLRPRPGGDVFDVALAGRVAVVDGIEENVDGGIALAVVVEDDPGRDLAGGRQPGHRFFFSPAEVEPLAERPRQILVAGVGNVFLGDDAFGVEVAKRLSRHPLPAGVEVVDYGIRGMDLAYDLVREYDAVVIVDAIPRGDPPGTLYVIEPQLDLDEVELDAHGMDPVKVLALARTLGAPERRTLVIGCEPETRMDPDDPELRAELSEPVRAALEPAVALVESVLEELIQREEEERQ